MSPAEVSERRGPSRPRSQVLAGQQAADLEEGPGTCRTGQRNKDEQLPVELLISLVSLTKLIQNIAQYSFLIDWSPNCQ